jgi:hypothetical protein
MGGQSMFRDHCSIDGGTGQAPRKSPAACLHILTFSKTLYIGFLPCYNGRNAAIPHTLRAGAELEKCGILPLWQADAAVIRKIGSAGIPALLREIFTGRRELR